jgi:hypothetical protein
MDKKQLGLTTAMAATLTSLGGCSSADDDWDVDQYARNDTQLCVDQNGYRVDDDYCEGGRYYVSGTGSRWYYANRGSRLPYVGDSIKDPRRGFLLAEAPHPGVQYSRSPAAANMTRSTAMARGGFGSSGRGFGGGRS